MRPAELSDRLAVALLGRKLVPVQRLLVIPRGYVEGAVAERVAAAVVHSAKAPLSGGVSLAGVIGVAINTCSAVVAAGTCTILPLKHGR